MRRCTDPRLGCLLAALLLWPAMAQGARRFPNVLLVTIDTLRADRLSGAGYERPTSPHLDRLARSGVRFTQARTVEPLTTPALASLLTSLHPHEHGSTRNGLRVRAGLASLPKILERRGYRTAAFVGNWTLKDKISGLAEHFGHYEEVFTRKRWLGLFASEANAADLNARSLAWLEAHLRSKPVRPFFLWVHYVEPHAPYRFHAEFAPRLGLAGQGNPPPVDRYDTEVAYVDHWAGRLFTAVRDLVPPSETLTVFTADHGESFGEHGYWGHGRHLYDTSLHVPLAVAWPGRLRPRTIREPITSLDVAPTLLALLGLPVPEAFTGIDWVRAVRGEAPAPQRVTFYQAHKGAVQPLEDPTQARRRGLLEVGVLTDGILEVLHLPGRERRLFPLRKGKGSAGATSAASGETGSPHLAAWLREVRLGLEARDGTPDPTLDAASAERLRSLGYLD